MHRCLAYVTCFLHEKRKEKHERNILPHLNYKSTVRNICASQLHHKRHRESEPIDFVFSSFNLNQSNVNVSPRICLGDTFGTDVSGYFIQRRGSERVSKAKWMHRLFEIHRLYYHYELLATEFRYVRNRQRSWSLSHTWKEERDSACTFSQTALFTSSQRFLTLTISHDLHLSSFFIVCCSLMTDNTDHHSPQGSFLLLVAKEGHPKTDESLTITTERNTLDLLQFDS